MNSQTARGRSNGARRSALACVFLLLLPSVDGARGSDASPWTTPVLASSRQAALTLNCGALESGAISAAAEVDQFTFNGQINERKTLTLTSSMFTATATVLAPSGAPVVTFNANSQQQLILRESGGFVIQVRASNLVSTGTYNIGLECLLPTSPVDATLVCGGLLSNRQISAASQVDQITFSGQANERKTLTLTSSVVTATATVFSPTGVVVNTFNANSQPQVTLPESGTYVMQVRASNLVSAGTYNIGLECLLPTNPVDATLNCGTLLSARSINAASQVDQLTFSGQANERKTLTLTSSVVTATATVFSPTGIVVNTFNANSQPQLTLPENGTYVIQVRASNLVSAGTYNIGLECLLPTSPVDATLVCGGLLSNRPINAASQVDQITFSGQVNERKTLTLTSSVVTATVTVFSPAAAVVVTFNANGQRQLVLQESGTYVIQVRANNLVGTGSYSLGLECSPPPPPCRPNTSLPGGFRPFSEVYYITGPNAGGDRLVVGRMPPEQRQMLNALSPPDQLNQRFCNPVELAPGLLAIAYVPTPNERNGDFNSFAGQLLDPANNIPFPNGIIPANRLGDPHAWRIVNQIGGPAFVSAASYSAVELASESIVAVFGSRLATGTRVAPSLPLPTVLEGSTVKVRDSAGVERLAGIFFVSLDQINFEVPPGTANGIATVTITSGNGSVSIGTMQIARVAPGLFAANANGRDAAAGVVLRVKTDGTQVFEPVSRFDQAQNRFVPLPIDLGPESEQVFLLLFGTGFRNRSNLSAVTVRIGGADTQVSYAGPTPGLVGLDQANVLLPRGLLGRGDVNVVMTVDGKAANVVLVNIR